MGLCPPHPRQGFPCHSTEPPSPETGLATTSGWALKQGIREAQSRGYVGLWKTPEYQREQRRSAAAAQGKGFISRAESRYLKPRKALDGQAQVRARNMYRQFLAMCNQIGEQQRINHRFRVRYAKRPVYERDRTTNYKARHWDRKLLWDEVRAQRMKDTSDGSATAKAIADLKVRTEQCTYCDKQMAASEKQTDHVVPLCAGGAHSLTNIVIACAACNGRKARG